MERLRLRGILRPRTSPNFAGFTLLIVVDLLLRLMTPSRRNLTDTAVRRTPCRSAASPPHERFVDVTPISLRRVRQLQRLVRQQRARRPGAHQVQSTFRFHTRSHAAFGPFSKAIPIRNTENTRRGSAKKPTIPPPRAPRTVKIVTLLLKTRAPPAPPESAPKMDASSNSVTTMSCLPNALPLSGGRPSAADHPLQRLVRRHIDKVPDLRREMNEARACGSQGAPHSRCHLRWRASPQVRAIPTSRRCCRDDRSLNSASTTKPHVRRTLCRSAVKAATAGR